MKLCYQVATPDVKISETVTAYQGDLEKSFKKLKECGYDGIELMTREPGILDVDKIKEYCSGYQLPATMICTGEVLGQDKLCFTDRDESVREAAVKRINEIIDFAAELGASVNLGRVKGCHYPGFPKETTLAWAIENLKRVTGYAKEKNVVIVIEPVTIMQTNFINSVADGMELMKLIDMDNCKLMLDIFHMNIEDKDIIESIALAKGKIGFVHLADNNRRAPGNCRLDFYSILKALKEKGEYDGAVSVEVFQLPDQDWTIEASAKHLRPIVDKINSEC